MTGWGVRALVGASVGALITGTAAAEQTAAAQTAAAQASEAGGQQTSAAPRSEATPAPNTAPDADGGLGEIVVTATRRETLLQRTPVAITAVTADTFDQLGAQTIEDLGRFVPGVFIPQAGFSGAQTPSIRGIGSFSLVTSASFPVAFYYDGLFQDRPFGNNTRQFDLERIEVLRGPQGVLFGRNATAGAIRIIYSLPTDQLAVRARLAAGSFGEVEGQASIRGPLSDWLKVGVAFGLGKSDGYGLNLFNGERVNGYDVENFRGTAVMDVAQNLQFILRGTYGRERNTIGLKQIFADERGRPILADNQDAALFRSPVLGVDEFANNLPSFFEVTRHSVSLEGIWKAGAFDVILLAGYNDALNVSDSDTDGGDNVIFLRPTSIFNFTRNSYDARSVELRFSSTSLARAQLDGGFFYINEFVNDRGSTLRFVALNGTVLGNTESVVGQNETNAYAGFVNGVYDVTDRLKLRAGVRYTFEEKESAGQARNLITGQLGPLTRARLSFEDWSPAFGLDYAFSPMTFGYLSATRGFKSGGFATDPATGALLPFDPETVWSYEAGLKTDLFGRKLRLNTAVFYSDYSDLQLAQNLPGGGAIVENAASARIYGVEVESVFRPTPRFTLSGSVAYLNARFEDYLYIARPPTFNLRGYALDRAPDWKASAIAEYRLPTRLGQLSFQGTYAFESEASFQSVPDSPVALAGPPPSPPFERSRLYTRRATALVDARIELAFPDKRTSIAVLGSNLTDSRFFGALSRLGGGTSTVGTVNQPRAFRVEFYYKH